MFCSNCGTQVGDTEKFCKVCGKPLVQAAMPVMQQAPVNQQPVSEQQVPAPKRSRAYGPQEQKKATKLCVISLILGVVIPLAACIIAGVAESLGSIPNYYLITMFSFIPSAAMIAGIALMIVVRIKYSKSKFGLVLMIIYCVYVAVALIFIIIALSSCSDFIGSSSCS